MSVAAAQHRALGPSMAFRRPAPAAAPLPARRRRVSPSLLAPHHRTAPSTAAARPSFRLQAAAGGDASLDVGNIVAFEHINLEVPDQEVARLFYGEGLGLTADPDTTGPERGGLGVVWYNVGSQQQLHICRGPDAQGLPPGGAVGLTLPGIDRLATRLEGVQGLLGEVAVSHIGTGRLEIRDPYGNAFVASEPPPDAPPNRCLGISYILLPCFPGTSGAIGDFYEATLGARVERGASEAAVVMGPGTRLVFKEDRSLGERTDQAVAALHSGWHIALYLADFGGPFRRVEAAGLIDNDHPFRDKCYGIEDALRNRQFRFRDVLGPAPSGGGPRPLLYRLAHEVRSVHHPRFMRPLYSRMG